MVISCAITHGRAVSKAVAFRYLDGRALTLTSGKSLSALFKIGIAAYFAAQKVLASARNLSKTVVSRSKIRFWRELYGDVASVSAGTSVSWDTKLSIDGVSSLKIGSNCTLRNCDISIGGGSSVEIHDGVELHNVSIFAADSAVVKIANDCHFNSFSSTNKTSIRVVGGKASWGSWVMCDAGRISVGSTAVFSMGDYSGIGENSEIRAEAMVDIGAYTMIAYNVTIFDTNTHSVSAEDRRREVECYWRKPVVRGEVLRQPVTIGSDCWIGQGAAILKGVTIGSSCVVGMQTVVGSGMYPEKTTIVSAKARHVAQQQ